MAHIQKHKKQSSWLLFSHNDREKDSKRTFSNENIDNSKTNLNYNLNYLLRDDFQSLSSYHRLNKRLEELKKGNALKKIPKEGFNTYEIRRIKKEYKEQGKEFIESDYYDYVHKDFRQDANTLVSLCIQIPRDKNGELVFKSLDEQKLFFEGVCNYLSNYFGKDNLIDLQIHMDETTPHLHGCFVPAYKDENGNERLSCKKVITLNFLQTLHPSLQIHLEEYLHKNNFSILQDTPTKSNVSLNEYKEYINLQEIQKDYAQRFKYVEEQKNLRLENIQKDYNDKLTQLNNNLEIERRRYNNMCHKSKEKEKEIKNLEALNEHSIQGDILQLGKTNLFGNGKSYTKEELDTIISNAKICDSKIYEYNNHKREIENLEKNYGEQVKVKNNMLESLSVKVEELKSENIQLKMYRDYVQKNDRNGFNEYTKDKVIVDVPVFGEDDFGRFSHHKEKRIVTTKEYEEMRKDDKEIKKVYNNGFEL